MADKTLFRPTVAALTWRLLQSLAIFAVLFHYGENHASAEDNKDEKKHAIFGAYQENNLDLEVKVQSGVIRVYRSWDGSRKAWSINPQHDPLQFSDEKVTDEYGNLVAKEISQGLRKFSNQGGGTYESGASAGGGSASGGSISPAVADFLQSVSADYCTVSDTGGPAIVAAQDGVKWVSGIRREWADFSADGLLQSWGLGNYRIGQAKHDTQGRISGYADTRDVQVLTYTYNQFDELRFIEDYNGAKVEYIYNPEGQLTEVVNADGRRIRYHYDADGNIDQRIDGDKDAPDANPENPDGEQVTFTLAYNGDKRIQSIKNDAGEGSDFTYNFDREQNTYTKIEKTTGNTVTETTSSVDEGLKSVVVNGVPRLRVIKLCEDTVIIDQFNRITYFDRDRLGRLQKITFPDETFVLFEHTLQNWPEIGKSWDTPTKPWGIKSFTTAEGTKFEYERDRNGEIVEALEKSPDGKVRRWKFNHDPYGNLTEYRIVVNTEPDDLEDFHGKWVYDDYGNPKQYINAKLATWNFKHNARGDLTEIVEPKFQSKWEFQYTRNGQLKYSKDPAGFEQTYAYNSRGLVKTYTEKYDDGQEAVWHYQYNRRRDVTKLTDPFGKVWNYEYDSAGRLKKTTDPDSHGQAFSYDNLDRVKSITDGNNVSITYDYFDTALPGGTPQTEIPFSPIVKVNYPTFSEEFHYNLRGRLTAQVLKPQSGDPLVTNFTYNRDGQVTKILYPDQKEAKYKYNGNGLLISSTLPGWGTTTIDYLKEGREIHYNHPNGGQTIQQFDVLGQQISERRADLHTEIDFQYDNVGNLEKFINSNGQVHDYVYGLGYRVIQNKIYPSADAPTPTKTININYNLRGDVKDYNDGETSTVYGLDKVGRILNATTNYGPFSKSHAYSYKDNGLPNTYTDPSGTTFQYLWDAADQFQGMVIPGQGNLTYGYNSTDWIQPDHITFPGGATDSFEYDPLRTVSRIKSKTASGDTFLDYDYVRSSLGIIDKKITEHGTYHYGYDDAYRLTSVNSPSLPDEDYAYDEFGNRHKLHEPPWSYDKNGAVLSDNNATYEYDDQGNRTKKTDSTGTTNYFYDESDRLIRVEKPLGTIVATYGYDPQGMRLWKEVDGVRTYFYYTDAGLVGEYDASGNELRSYAYEPGTYWGTAPLFLRDSSGYNYFHNDSLGTPQKITNKSGTVRWQAQYSGFGKATETPAGVQNPIRFPGQYFDPETGLHQNFMRDYDPAIAAYLGQDPYGILTGANRYAYAYGDPVHLSDPTGEIVPLIVAGLVVVDVAFTIYTGFEIYQCAELLNQNCFSFEDGSICQKALIDAGLAVAGYGLVKVVEKGALWGLRTFRQTETAGNLAREIGILRDAARGKGNFGLGSATRVEANRLGKAWVGNGSKLASDGKTLVSENGLRQYRPPTFKPKLDSFQANFEQRFPGQTGNQWQSNGHLDIIDKR